MDHVKGMFVEKMKSLSEVRSSNSSTVEAMTSDSSSKIIELFNNHGWAIPLRSNFRFNFEQKEILYKLFMDGEKTGNKMSPDGAAKVIHEYLAVKDYVTPQQIRSLFSRWSKQLRENTLKAPVRRTNYGSDERNEDIEAEDDENSDSANEDSLQYCEELSVAVAQACSQWQVNDWVVVKYASNMFPGQVIHIEDAGFMVDCMHEGFAGRNCFHWPHPRDDQTLYSLDQLLCHINHHQSCNNCGGVKLEDEDFQKAKNLLMNS